MCSKKIFYQEQAEKNIQAFMSDLEYEERYRVIQKVQRALKHNNIDWCLGWSANLFLRGIIGEFHDFDIIIDESHSVLEIETVLKSIGAVIKTRYNAPCFTTDWFVKYYIDGVEMDIMKGFGIKLNGLNYRYNFSKEEIEFIDVNGMKIPIVASEVEFLLYAVLEDSYQPHRTHSRCLIQEYLEETKLLHRNVMTRAMEEKLNPWIKQEICELLMK